MMNINAKAVLLWISAALLLFASAWSLNIAISNWWAADFHTEYRHAYASRGNTFFFVALAFCGAFAGMVVAIFRLRKKRRLPKT